MGLSSKNKEQNLRDPLPERKQSFGSPLTARGTICHMLGAGFSLFRPRDSAVYFNYSVLFRNS